MEPRLCLAPMKTASLLLDGRQGLEAPPLACNLPQPGLLLVQILAVFVDDESCSRGPGKLRAGRQSFRPGL